MASQQQQFETLLEQLMSADNNVRGQAEKYFYQNKTSQPNEVSQALLQVGRTCANPELRSFALILLRRILVGVEPKSLWSKINAATQALIKRELLTGLEREQEKRVLSCLCDLTVELASQIFEEDSAGWNELLEWFVRLAPSPDANHKQSVLLILSQLSAYVVDAFLDKFAVIKNMLLSSFQDADLQVKLVALEATVGFVQVFNQVGPRREMQPMIPLMLDVLACSLNNKDEETAQAALKHFIDLAELDPGFLKTSVSLVAEAMLKICQATELDPSTRQLALEFLTTFIENKPTLCKNIPGFVKSMINILLQMMLDMEDPSSADWNNSDEADDNTENSIVAQECLDRMCLALNGEIIVPIIFEHIPNLLANKENWKCRHVGLMALSMIGEGCYDFLKSHLDKIMGMILPLFTDEHPRVRWAAANTAGQMSTDFGPKFQKLFHAEILPRLAKLLEDTANPKVQSHAAAATINFCEKFDSNTLTAYLADILSKLIILVKSGKRSVQEQAITAVASIAGCAGKNFIPYYDNFVPLLKELLMATQPNSQSKEFRMLRAKSIECISLIGIAVGKEKFKNDAFAIMEVLSQIQNSNLDADDPQREFMLQAWTRISTCLGEDFIPYLKFVMPPLLQSASKTAGVHILEEEPQEEEQGWEYVSVGETKIAIHTSALEEKATSCNLLLSYASEMKDGFFPYVEEVSKLCVPLMSFYYHDGVRLSAFSIMPQLLQSVRLYLEKNKQDKRLLNDLFWYIYPHLLEAITTENDQEVLVVAVESLHEILIQVGPNILPAEKVKDLMHQVKVLIVAMQQRRADVIGRNPEEGQDEDESVLVKDELAKEDDIANELAEVVGAVVKNHTQLFLQSFPDLFPTIVDMLQKNKSPSERQLALCVFDDVVEHTQQHSHQLFPHFLPFMLEYATDAHHGVRQAACFGLGVCAHFGADQFKPIARQALEVLVGVITKPDARLDRNAPPTENAISSVGKIILYQTDVVQEKIADLVNLYISWLPITVDWIEAKVVHQQLIDLIKKMNTLAFGQGFSNLPKILSVFAEVVQLDPSETLLITANTRNDIVQVLQSMQQQFPGQLLQQAFNAVTPANQLRLQKIMSGQLPPMSDQ